MAGVAGGVAIGLNVATLTKTAFAPGIDDYLLGYHGSNNPAKIASRGYFKSGQLYVTSSYDNAAKYAGQSGRVFAAYVPRQNLAGMSARYIPKINMSSGADELPINVAYSRLVRAVEVNSSAESIGLDDVFSDLGLTNAQYHQQLMVKSSKIRSLAL